MKRYHILRHIDGAGLPRASKVRHRRDAAVLAFERMVYDAIAADAALDTRRGHEAMRSAEAVHNDTCLWHVVSIGQQTVTFHAA